MARTASTCLLSLALAACGSETTLHSGGRDTDEGLPTSDDVRPDDLLPPIAVCGSDADTTQPGEAVNLIGENSYDPDGNVIVNYRWSLVLKPAGSLARLSSSEANVDDFTPDIVGDYGVTLTVTNDYGQPSAVCARTIHAVPSQELYIEMTSQYPSDDMALQLSESGDLLSFCSQQDCSQKWGATGKDDDPEFLLDDVDGGPEVIAIAKPASGKYTISVFDDKDGVNGIKLAENEITVVVYLKGVAKWRGTHTLQYEGLSATFAEITFPSGSVKPL